MIIKTHVLVVAATVIGAIALPGCESPQPQPPVPSRPPITAPATIQLRVVVHLANNPVGADDQIGNRTNKGCRLTENEMLNYLMELRDFVTQSFGVGVDLQWNWPPNEYYDPILGLLQRDQFNGMNLQTFMDRVDADPDYDNTKINLYFAGWIQPLSGPSNSLFAATLDPTGGQVLARRAWVFINDLDLVPQPPGVNPYYTAGYWIQCHELCHYWLRRDTSDPLNPDAEHWDAQSDLLLRAGGVMPHPHKLHPTEDTDRIRRRLELGLWNSPQLTDLD